MLLPLLIICLLPLVLALTLHIPDTIALKKNNITSHPQPLSHPLLNMSSSYLPSNNFWYCFNPAPQLSETTFRDCHCISQALDELDPTGLEEFVFSPRAVADIRLPFFLRCGTCVLDLRGIEEDGWDMFPIGVLAEEVDDLAMT